MAPGGSASGLRMRDLVAALQSLRYGQADAVEVRGDLENHPAARMSVGDFITVFELDVVVTELPDGFRVALRNASGRTIRVDV